MKGFLSLLVLSVFFTQSALACIGGKGFLPENNLNIPPVSSIAKGARGSSMSEAEFNSVIDKVYGVYRSEVARFGGNLVFVRHWSDGTVNAYAHQQGRDFMVDMFGGLARHPSITTDALALVACHEIGHHIGGAPRNTTQQGMSWASIEGQSDYFATTKCLRKVFERDDNASIVSKMNVDTFVQKKCEDKHRDPNEQAMCMRISMAGFSGASMFASLQNSSLPRFDTPDPSVVSVTFEQHPAYQCRLDTYFNGAICDVSESEDFSATDPKVGACNQNFGFRPLCWFKPSGSPNPNPNPTPTPTPTPQGVAKTPTVGGQTSVVITNPNQLVVIDVDVSNFQGASYIAVEFSKPNQVFSNPNSSEPDKVNGLKVEVYPSVKGTYRLLASKQLPNWGVYQFRVIGLDRNKAPVSKNSQPLEIRLQQSVRLGMLGKKLNAYK